MRCIMYVLCIDHFIRSASISKLHNPSFVRIHKKNCQTLPLLYATKTKTNTKTKTIQIKHATVVIDYIKALNNYKNLNDWSAQNVLSGNILINCHVPHFLHAILKNRRLLVMSEQSCIKNSEITSYVINPWFIRLHQKSLIRR